MESEKSASHASGEMVVVVCAVVVVVLEGGVAGWLRTADVGGGGAGEDPVQGELLLHLRPAGLHHLLLQPAGLVLTAALDRRQKIR